MDGYATEFNLPLFGQCLECKIKKLLSRQNLLRTLKTRKRLDNINDEAKYSEEDEISDSEAESESGIDLNMPAFRNFAPPNSADTIERLEEWAELHDGLARRTEVIIPTAPFVSYNALIEDLEDDGEVDENEEPESVVQEAQVRRGLRWRSWIPLPTRLLQARSYQRLVSVNADDVLENDPLIKSEPKKRPGFQSLLSLSGKRVKG
jgi:hypothetical protein